MEQEVSEEPPRVQSLRRGRSKENSNPVTGSIGAPSSAQQENVPSNEGEKYLTLLSGVTKSGAIKTKVAPASTDIDFFAALSYLEMKCVRIDRLADYFLSSFLLD